MTKNAKIKLLQEALVRCKSNAKTIAPPNLHTPMVRASILEQRLQDINYTVDTALKATADEVVEVQAA
jgi:hypothetical protein